MTAPATVPESFERLHRAGWWLSDERVLTAMGMRWLVRGTRGRLSLAAWGTTQAEAWHNACRQAQLLEAEGSAGAGIWRMFWLLAALGTCIAVAALGLLLWVAGKGGFYEPERTFAGLVLFFNGVGWMVWLGIQAIRRAQHGGREEILK